MINNFGKEELSYLDNNYFTNLIMNQPIENGYVQLIKDIYLNKEHPENQTVKVDNINDKYALVFNEGKWNTILKYELRELLHKKNYTILKMHYDKLKNTMSVPKREETYAFLKRDDTTDPHMMYVIDKIITLFNSKENVNTQLLETKKEISDYFDKRIKKFIGLTKNTINYNESFYLYTYFLTILKFPDFIPNGDLTFHFYKNKNTLLALQVINRFANENKIRVEDAITVLHEYILE